MEELFSATLETWIERRRARRRLGAIHYRSRPRRWPWLAALSVAVALAWFILDWGWPSLVVGLIGGLAILIGLGTSVLARVYSIGHERILLQGAVTAWPEIVRCQIDCEGIVECRTAAENYRVRAPREFVDALRHCLRERGLEAEQSSMEVEL